MVKKHKIIRGTLALILITSTALTQVAFGATTENSSLPVTATVAAAKFKVTVPSILPIHVDSQMAVTVSSDTVIHNQSSGPITVDNVQFEIADGWDAIPFITEISTLKIGQNKVGFSLNDCETQSGGAFEFDASKFGTIGAQGKLPLIYDAKVSAQKHSIISEAIANVIFTLSWDKVLEGSADMEEETTGSEWLTPGDSRIFNFNFKDTSSQEITFSSSNPSVASVSLLDNKAKMSGTIKANVQAHRVGEAVITGTLGDGTSSSILVRVVNNPVVELRNNWATIKTDYYIGENFDDSGISFIAVHADGRTSIANDYTMGNNVSLQVGQTSVTVTCRGLSVSIPIKVKDIEVGTKHIENGYEYSYGEEIMPNSQYELKWAASGVNGWGVRIISDTNSNWVSYNQPAESIRNRPVTSYSCLFFDRKLSELQGEWNNSNVTNMCATFAGATTEDEHIDLSRFFTAKVTNMHAMFEASYLGATVDLGSFDTSNVSEMQYMFSMIGSSALKLSSFNTANVTNMERMFMGEVIESLDLSSFDVSKVSNTNEMFDCWVLERVIARTRADADKFISAITEYTQAQVTVK